MDKLVEKWKQVLSVVPINKVYWENISKYCEKYSNRLAKDNISILPVALRILSKIDLSRVVFVDDYKICESKEISIRITPQQILDYKLKMGVPLPEFIDHAIVEEQSYFLNEYIEIHGGVVINELGYYYGLEINKIVYKSYILPLTVYRNYKLNKLIDNTNENIK